MNEFRLPLEYNWELAHKKIAKTEYYSLNLVDTNVVEVSTIKGIVEIVKIWVGGGGPTPAFASATQFYINNPKLLLTEANRDNIYIQYSVYYKPFGITDNAIPYVISNGVLVPDGVGFQIYNANPAVAGADNWEGKFYFYYELYTK